MPAKTHPTCGDRDREPAGLHPAGVTRCLDFVPPPLLEAAMSVQHGCFAAEQAYAAGFDRGQVQRLREAGLLVSVRRGVYAIAAAYDAVAHEERHLIDAQAALLVLHDDTTLSHVSAAVWRGLPLLRPDLRLVHVTRPVLKASRTEAGIHHHPGALPAGHRHVVNGVSLTGGARTAVDIARAGSFAQGLAAVDSALRSGISSDEVREVLFFCASWPGSRGASRAVACGDARSANPGESFSRAVLIESRLAPTDLQVPVHDIDGLVGYADFGWLPWMVLGEFDGRYKYGETPEQMAAAIWAEKLREDRLRALGFEVVRWTWADLQFPARLVARIHAARARAIARGVSVA